MNDKILIGILSFLAGVLPKIYELITKKKKEALEHDVNFAVALALEGKEIRLEMRAEIAILKEEIDDLKNRNNELFEENLILRRRVSDFEYQLNVYKLENNHNSRDNTNSRNNVDSNYNTNSSANKNSSRNTNIDETGDK